MFINKIILLSLIIFIYRIKAKNILEKFLQFKNFYCIHKIKNAKEKKKKICPCKLKYFYIF